MNTNVKTNCTFVLMLRYMRSATLDAKHVDFVTIHTQTIRREHTDNRGRTHKGQRGNKERSEGEQTENTERTEREQKQNTQRIERQQKEDTQRTAREQTDREQREKRARKLI